ncbi:MAG: SGNH/GDSL hydrolase family protein [Gammaproteobacteria bacterium]|nr:SGNH/GDSL hydrolase family protein [Gammaproteobacteria bacterium]
MMILKTLRTYTSASVIFCALLMIACGGGNSPDGTLELDDSEPRSNSSTVINDETETETENNPAVELGNNWIFLGDSETAGRANEVTTKSQVDAFKNIWNQSFSTPPSVYVDGISGRKLQETFAEYRSITYRGNATLVHFQESGSQDSTQDTPEKYTAVFENMVRAIVADSPFAVISVETAYSFEVDSSTNRYWVHHNAQMRKKVAELKAEGITVYIAEVDRNIQELISQKRIEIGTDAGQQIVWGDTNNSISRHYTGLGNLMVALSIYDALGYDVNQLDLTGIPSSEINTRDKQLCINIINSY